jgi:RimJ/RimL family protein N-acetyltransferase
MIGVEPLRRLRLRTPRLELRLGSRDELLELGELARRGIHPADEMPFAVAWTDRSHLSTFVAEVVGFHTSQLDAWDADDWSLPLLVWERGRLVGSQGMGAEHFSSRRVVGTGSWLGHAYQGRGMGAEMRAAVLELAFRGLGAVAATSGHLEGNETSRRVSERLGYVETGTSTASPRGEPVVVHELRLDRHDWTPPIPVDIEGLGPCLPLFGA